MIPVHAANPGPFTGAGNWTYLLPGARTLLVDAGVGKPDHLDRIAQLAPDGPGAVVVTHIHEDHASGAGAIAARWPQTQFFKFAWPERDGRYGVQWQPLADGDVIDAGDSALRVVHTPGHSPDHICLWHEESRALLAGDLVVKGSTVVIPATHGGSLADYLKSLDRVAALHAKRFLPAHGELIDDPAALIAFYVAHRREREQQVIDALASGLTTIDAITTRIYRDLSPELVPMAMESVLAHMQKLQHDGVVQFVGRKWQRRETRS